MNTSDAGHAPAAATSSSGYQTMLVILLSINFGIVFFDRTALSFLMPFVQPDLNLSNTQVGILTSALSFSWAIAALGIGMVADKIGHRKALLVILTLAFSACSFLSGIAASFVAMLCTRLLMGVAEGGIMPISQSFIVSEVKPERRGLAMGITQNFGSNLLGSFVAPVALVAFASAFGWRHAFFLAGAPGLIAAICIWMLVKPPNEGAPVQAVKSQPARKLTLREAFAERNVLLCAVMGVLLVAYLVVCQAFMPLFLTSNRHYDSGTMSWLMGTLGLSATIGSFVISGLSDRIGRRPLMIVMPFIALILPIAALYFEGSVWALAAIFFVGWGVVGIFPMFMGTIPAESVDREHIATVLGLCMGIPEVLGGVLAPSIAGSAADKYGLQAPLWIMFGLTFVAGLVAFGLRETAPRVLARRPLASSFV